MISRMCVMALTLGGSILSSQAGQMSLSTERGRVAVDCRSDQANVEIRRLQDPLLDVIDRMRASLRKPQDSFVLRDQAITPAQVMNKFTVTYEVRDVTPDRLEVKAYVDLEAKIEGARRARLVDEVAERAGVSADQLENKIVFDGGECQIPR